MRNEEEDWAIRQAWWKKQLSAFIDDLGIRQKQIEVAREELRVAESKIVAVYRLINATASLVGCAVPDLPTSAEFIDEILLRQQRAARAARKKRNANA